MDDRFGKNFHNMITTVVSKACSELIKCSCKGDCTSCKCGSVNLAYSPLCNCKCNNIVAITNVPAT